MNSSEWARRRASRPIPNAVPASSLEPVASMTASMAMIPSPTSIPPNSPVTISARHVRCNRSVPSWTVFLNSSTSSSSRGWSVRPEERRAVSLSRVAAMGFSVGHGEDPGARTCTTAHGMHQRSRCRMGAGFLH